jgi:hypothetical protein
LVASQNGHQEVAKLLLEHEDVAVNQAELEVREGRERRREGLGSTPRCCGGGRLTSQLRG